MESLSEIGSAKDVVQALFEYFVDPMLPLKSSEEAPLLSQQQSVAKQVQAVVLLYNYYHRQQHLGVDFLSFESFCKMVVILKPALMPYMKFTQQSDNPKLDDPQEQLSVTEKAIFDACNVSLVLDASKDDLNMEGWPISKVAVLLVDSEKFHCLLMFGCITHGVWSVLEKDVISSTSSESGLLGKHVNKRKRVNKKAARDDWDVDEAGFQQIAFSAVKDTTGINRNDLTILESHKAYSLSKEKTAACFYIMQCSQSLKEDGQILIKDAIESLQGPLVRKSSCSWAVTPVVEYLHVFPYAGIISNWFSSLDKGENTCVEDIIEEREVSESSMNVNLNSSQEKEETCDKEVAISRDNPDRNCGTEDCVAQESSDVNSSQRLETPGEKEMNENGDKPDRKCNGCDSNGDDANTVNAESAKHGDFKLPSDQDSMDMFESSTIFPQNEDRSQNIPTLVKVYRHQKRRTCSTESDINVSANIIKAETTDSALKSCATDCKSKMVNSKNTISGTVLSDQVMAATSDNAVIPFQLSARDQEKLLIVPALKGNELSQTALRVLIKRREKLSFQVRDLEDEIAVCDKKIQTILDGGEDDLAVKLEAIIDCCNDLCLKGKCGNQDGTCPHVKDLGSRCMKKRKLSEAILNLQSKCQDLDDICSENNWTFPIYHVSSSNGGFLASVTIKGIDFECSVGSNLQQNPREARESAAAEMIAKLQEMAGRRCLSPRSLPNTRKTQPWEEYGKCN